MGEQEVSASESRERDDRIIKKRRERPRAQERGSVRTRAIANCDDATITWRDRVREREVGALGLKRQFSILNCINEDHDCRI